MNDNGLWLLIGALLLNVLVDVAGFYLYRKEKKPYRISVVSTVMYTAVTGYVLAKVL